MSQPSFDLEIDPTPTFRVSELTASIGTAVRRSFPEELWVRGEIDSLSRSGAGHIYFDLVEGMGNERVALRVTLFRSVAVAVERHLARHRMRLENGLEIRIMGRVELYEARGQINLRMSGIDPTYTLGRLAQDRDRLIAVLTARGCSNATDVWRCPAAAASRSGDKPGKQRRTATSSTSSRRVASRGEYSSPTAGCRGPRPPTRSCAR